jgi:CheY-like chemotaxis protein
MAPRTARILCVDSSHLRLQMLARTLGKSGFEVWTAHAPSEAVCLAAGMRFEALVVDRTSSWLRSDIWQCLTEAQPQLPILVHEGTSRAVELCGGSPRERIRPINPEVILGILMLLLGNDWKPVAYAPRAATAA